MATLQENIAKAIEDFDSIEAAIEECGVDVPYDTDTSQYGEKVREVYRKGLADNPDLADFLRKEDQFVKSVDTDELAVDENGNLTIIQVDKSKVDGLIEIIKLGGVALEIKDKAVNIPIANSDNVGVIKSSTGDNKVSVGTNGEASVDKVNVNTLTQSDGEMLILNCGSAAN